MSPRSSLVFLLASSCLFTSLPAQAQLEEESVQQSADLSSKDAAYKGKKQRPLALTDYENRRLYQIRCFRRLLPLEATIRQCVNKQRMLGGEFHGRLDFSILPDGSLKSFKTRRKEQLEACLLPHVLPLKFPPFTHKERYTLQVLVASPGVRLGHRSVCRTEPGASPGQTPDRSEEGAYRAICDRRATPPGALRGVHGDAECKLFDALGRRVEAKPVAVYKLDNQQQRRTYKQAVMWVVSPWSQAINHCNEWVDKSMGFGYTIRLHLQISPKGRALSITLKVQGKLASTALKRLLPCVKPFAAGLRAPPHEGPGPLEYTMGSRTASWRR